MDDTFYYGKPVKSLVNIMYKFRWSILDTDISGRGGREVMVLISEWNTDQMQMIDLNNPYLHHEPFGLFKMGKIVTSLATLGNNTTCTSR